MIIAQISNSVYPLNIGGIETHVYNISKYLSRDNHVVDVLTPQGACFFRNSSGTPQVDRISVIRKFKYLFSRNYDVVHIHGAVSSNIMISTVYLLIFIYISKLLGRKIVYTPHGLVDGLLIRGGIIRRIYLTMLRIFIFGFVDKFIAVYPNQVKILVNAGIPRHKIAYIPNAISERFFKSMLNKQKTGRNTICYIGRIDPYKRLADLLTVLPEILSVHDVSVLIVGPDYGDLNNLLNLVSRYNLKNTVSILGEVSENRKHEILINTSVFVTPSSYEAFGISTCEAMACNVPIISANNPGAKFLLENGKCGMLYEIGNKDQLRKCVTYILNNPKIAKKIGRLGKRRASLFRWCKVAEKLERIYYELLN